MLDIKIINEKPDYVKEKSKLKGYDVSKIVDEVNAIDAKRRHLAPIIDELRSKRRIIAESAKGSKPSEAQIKAGIEIKKELIPLEDELEKLKQELQSKLKLIPNIPLKDVPVGKSEADNVVSKKVGDKPQFDFPVKNHWEIAQKKGWIDKERAVKVAGSRFLYIKGDLAQMEFALWQFAIEQLTDHKIIKKIIDENNLKVADKPFCFVLPPAMATTEVFEATGRLNKEEQTYQIADEELWLNASAEHVLAPMYMGEILEEKQFPIRLLGYTTAFRKEAGTYGKDMEGMLRLHQFNKLEMESFNLPEDGKEEYRFMIAVQEYLMQSLDLPYNVVTKCTADIGGPNASGTDIDTWLPGQKQYRETHTADYMTDYQARRTKTRVKRANGEIQLVHNNDATAFSERPLIAIIENNQTKDGDVIIPKILRPYMQGREKI